jgi:hypothetical protein
LTDSMPSWTSFGLSNPEEPLKRTKIEHIVRQIARYDLDSIRAAIAERIDTGSNLEDAVDGKAFVLTRFLFRLPETVPSDSPHVIHLGGGWLGRHTNEHSEHREDSRDLLARWPWSEDASGTWRLTGTFVGFNGPPDDLLHTFDYCRKTFGRRTPLK